MYRTYERRPFNASRCTGCGECLHRCPVMHMPADQARNEMEQLLAWSRWVSAGASQAKRPRAMPSALRRCTSCFACNLVCPEDCRPANLILDIWHETCLAEGLPARAAHFLPHSRPNFRTRLLDSMPHEERQAVALWRQPRPAREFLYAGCNLMTTAHLTFSRLFEGVEIRGGLDYCCGEMLFRMGLYESVEQVARRLTRWFRLMGAERVYLVCTAGLNMFRNVLPQFGAEFQGIEFEPFAQRLLERIEQGDLRLVRPLGLSVSLQDSCHTRIVEPGFAEVPRNLLAAVGVQVAEAPHSRETQLCCGIGGGFAPASAYNPVSLLVSATATLRDHRRVQADATCVYCSGCLEMMSVGRLASGGHGRPVVHLLELVQRAMGETPPQRSGWLARQFILGAVQGQFPSLVSRHRLWLPEIPVEPDEAGAL